MQVESIASLPAVEVPGYELVERIGSGGFGEVFHARHRVIGREVAIKIIHARHCTDATTVARFVAEARAVNKVTHPNIVEIFDYATLADGRPYCVMELIRGETLRAVLARRGKLPLAEALAILRGIADAIDAAHASGIAHRDLKPENVFVLAGGGIKLIDFGLAKLITEEASVTQTGQVFGTPLYMSPEQCRGRDVTLATDAYSFGALAYHVLTGVTPFTGEPLDLAVQHLNDDPKPPSTHCRELPKHVDDAVLALLAKEAGERPARLRDAVNALAGDAKVRRTRRSRRGPLVIVGVGVAAVGLAVGVVRWRSSSAPSEPEAWSQRTVRIDFDGTTITPSVSRDGDLLYSDSTGWWRHDFTAGTTERIPLVPDATRVLMELPDGRMLAGDRDSIHLVDPRDRTSRRILDGELPSASPDGTRIAAWDRDRWLVIRDLATGTVRRLVQRGQIVMLDSPPRWSPEGAVLLWGYNTVHDNRRHVFVTRVADGVTTELAGAAAVTYRRRVAHDFFNSIGFLADGRIAYCSDVVPEVRARALWGGPETTLAKIDDAASECMIAGRGRGLVVTVGYSQNTFGVLELERPSGQPATMRQVGGPNAFQPLTADAQRVWAFANARGGRTLAAIDFATGVQTARPTCPGARGVVRRGDELLHLTHTTASKIMTIRLLAFDTCAVVDEWQLPAMVRMARADCHAGWCVIGVTHEDRVSVWKLSSGKPATELAHVPLNGPPPMPDVAISPDGQTVALALARMPGRDRLYRIRVDDGSPRAVPFDSQVDGIAWNASGQLLVSGQNVDGAPFALVEVDPDGTRRPIWSSKTQYLAGLFTDPARQRLVGDISTWRQELLMIDPDQGIRSD